MKNKINKNIYPWIIKWHFIGGIISAPIVILLALTGLIYLFKDKYEAPQKAAFAHIEQKTENKMSFQQQWQLAKKEWKKVPSGMIVPQSADAATEFISGKFSHKSHLYIDPFGQKVKGIINVNETDMYKVRKLHGELLLGSYGTKVVELVASWMVVLIITGLYLFWPRSGGIKSFFSVRTNQSKRILFRDIHALLGFWFSFLLLIVLAGGLPWTDVFGKSYQWVQKVTNSGYPKTWDGKAIKSTPVGQPLALDEIVLKAKAMNLDGTTIIELPESPTGVYSVYNETKNLSAMEKIHLDQYSGEVLKKNTWADIGLMMKSRQWVMAFHQGEFGLWNWLLMIFIAAGLLLLSITAIATYFFRKKTGSLSVPKVPKNLSPSMALVIAIVALGVLLPLFGLSVLIIFLIDKFRSKQGVA
ncbi:PepSY domain-containing protein [Emticicia sp. 21SJ11W-3]|uniref:PepSY-associated TM helix domain-containing protein n=1 Tax=Emticicia sp. 21SJ11W-3 TaxID=2916755 RepID=UPI00209FC57B|nr:PepSY domain-containing protein [Emticicia sp. 21SJ11W-3]UTA69046.1 PepSY domain-containing protein [Emticicia sp. 21SJ11W-3]